MVRSSGLSGMAPGVEGRIDWRNDEACMWYLESISIAMSDAKVY